MDPRETMEKVIARVKSESAERTGMLQTRTVLRASDINAMIEDRELLIAGLKGARACLDEVCDHSSTGAPAACLVAIDKLLAR